MRKKRVVQSERGARRAWCEERAWCADEVETKKRRGGVETTRRGVVGVVRREGFGAKEERGARRAWCKESVVQGEQRGARRAAWCNDGRDERVLSVVQRERGAKEEGPTMGNERKGRGRRLPTDRPSS